MTIETEEHTEAVFSASDGLNMVSAARESINGFLSTNRMSGTSTFLKEDQFRQKLGCFVTLKSNNVENSLRGCIGFPEPQYTLSKAIPTAAVYAATKDPRFVPLTLEDLGAILVEVSVLTRPKKIEFSYPRELLEKIKIGSDGLILKWDFGSGLLLPQVSREYNWSVEEYLQNLSLKAGAHPLQWSVPGTQVYRFRAQVFLEKEPKGQVILDEQA